MPLSFSSIRGEKRRSLPVFGENFNILLVSSIKLSGGEVMFKVVDKLGTALDRASVRQTVLTDNLANVNTPGFKRSDVQPLNTFPKELQKASNPRLARTNARHLPGIVVENSPFNIIQDQSTTMRNDGNNVDPDRERVLLLENQLYYESLIDAVSRKLGQIRSVIGEGRR